MVVATLVTEGDDGERIALFYRPPHKRPEWKPLIKAAAKTAGVSLVEIRGAKLTHDETQRKFVAGTGKRVLDRWVDNDLQQAFAARRGEGYYRKDRHGGPYRYGDSNPGFRTENRKMPE